MSNHEQVYKNGLEFEHFFSAAHAVGDQSGVTKGELYRFGRLCIPSGPGGYCLVDIAKGVANHSWFQSKQDMLDAEILSNPLGEVYYATATFKEAGSQFQGRKAENALALRALRVDADVDWKFAASLTDKRDPKKYQTKQEALAAIEQFYRRVGLPRPLIVDSGNGYHCYWPLSEDAPCDKRLKAVLENLKGVYQSHGFLFDDAVTADFARVLRLPGTFNGKNKSVGPQEVHVVDWGDDPHTLDELDQIIRRVSVAHVDEPGNQPLDWLGAYDGPKLDSNDLLSNLFRVRIFENKKAIQGALDHLAMKGFHEREPDWYLVIKQVKGALTEEGHTKEESSWLYEQLRAWSSRSGKHTDPALRKKFDQSSGAGSLKGLFSIAAREGWRNPGADIFCSSGNIECSDDRRQRQIDEDREIGEGIEFEPRGLEHFIEADLLERYVLLKSGSYVFDRKYPREILSMSDFTEANRASLTESVAFNPETKTYEPKQLKSVPLWRKSPQRKAVFSQTFMPGKPEFLTHNGQELINTWRPYLRIHEDQIDRRLVAAFVIHVHYLFGRRTNDFLDWLGHLEQYPGVLRHSAWLHISTKHGRGRNWMLGLLARVWPGQTAACFDLGSYLKTGFNGELSRKVFAYVDEIKAQTTDRKWDESNRLRELVNQEFRMINGKYERQHVEMNCCGWVVCSNHRNALAIDNDDRRWECVLMPDARPPKSAAYYEELYRLRENPLMIESVAAYLRYRDISGFNPGRHAKMDDSKGRVINALRTEVDIIANEIRDTWHADVITPEQLKKEFGVDTFGSLSPSHFGALDRYGITAVARQAKHGGRKTRYRIIRNHDQWEKASSEDIFKEIDKKPPATENVSEVAPKIRPVEVFDEVIADWGED